VSLLIEQAAPAVSLRSRFRSGIAWNFISAASLQGGTFLGNVLLANILGRSVYGEYAVVQSAAVSIALFAQFGTGNIAAKYVAELRDSDPLRAGRILALCGTVAAIFSVASGIGLVAASPWLASQTLHQAGLTGALMLGAIFLISSSLAGFQIGVLTGLEKYRRLGIIHLCCAVVQILMTAAAGWLYSVPGAVAGMGAASVIRWWVLFIWMRRELRTAGIALTFRDLGEERSVVLRVALPAGITAFTVVPAMWLGNAVLCRQPGGFAQMATYSACFNMLTAVLFLPWVIDKVTISLLNHQKGRGDGSGYRDVFWLNIRTVLGCVVIAATAVMIFGQGLLRLYGKSFTPDGYPTLALLMAASIPEAITVAINQLFFSRERIWTAILGVALPRDAVMIACAYVMIPGRGSLGLASAYLASRLLAATSSTAMAYRVGLKL
jgi:O-antigen/teichoic acid export membrane protein